LLRSGLAGALAMALAACVYGPNNQNQRFDQGKKSEPAPAPAKAEPGKLAPGDTVKVALILPLSGPNEKLGRALQRAAQFGAQDGRGAKIQIMTLDTRSTEAGATEAATKAVADGAHIVVGPLHAAEVRAVKARTAAANVNVIAFSNVADVAGGNTFLLSFQEDQQIDAVIAYAAKNGHKRIGVFAPRNSAGEHAIDAAKKSASRHGAEVVRTGTYTPRSLPAITAEAAQFAGGAGVDRRGRVGRREGLAFDAVLVPDAGDSLKMVASMLNYYDVYSSEKLRFLGTARWDNTSTHREPSLRNAWYANLPEANERFVSRYKGAGGEEPPRIASLAYDAMMVVAQLARATGGPDLSAAAIANPAGYNGVDGPFRFTADGFTERLLPIYEIGRGEAKEVSKPGQGFAGRIN
jgi:ABC-type branched-subunit amino acid transport system substrate-binding protein